MTAASYLVIAILIAGLAAVIFLLMLLLRRPSNAVDDVAALAELRLSLIHI